MTQVPRSYDSVPSHVGNMCYNILEPLLEDDINNQEVDLQLMIYNVYILYMFKGG